MQEPLWKLDYTVVNSSQQTLDFKRDSFVKENNLS